MPEVMIAHLEEKLLALEARLTQHETTSIREGELVEAAVVRAREEVDRRLEEMNQFRRQLSEERGNYVSRDILDTRLTILITRIETVEKWVSNMTGRMWSMGVALSMVVVVLNIAIRFLWK